MSQKRKKATAKTRERLKELKAAGIDVVNIAAKVSRGILDGKTRREVEKKLDFRLYKAKDRDTISRLQPPSIEKGIFVLHTGEFCAATDIEPPWGLRKRTKERKTKR
jgi:hypothetical protein